MDSEPEDDKYRGDEDEYSICRSYQLFRYDVEKKDYPKFVHELYPRVGLLTLQMRFGILFNNSVESVFFYFFYYVNVDSG